MTSREPDNGGGETLSLAAAIRAARRRRIALLNSTRSTNNDGWQILGSTQNSQPVKPTPQPSGRRARFHTRTNPRCP